MKKILDWITAIVISGCCAACTIQPIVPQGGGTRAPLPQVGKADASSVPVDSDASAYRIKPLDPIIIQYSGIPEQPPVDVVVNENGEINLPHLGLVKASGLTSFGLEREIERRYKEGQIYRNVSINVMLTAKSYYILGEVNASGQFPLTSGTTLMQAIAAARGPSPYASNKVTITRQGQIYKYNIKDIERHPTQDVKLEAGDLIKVLRSWF